MSSKTAPSPKLGRLYTFKRSQLDFSGVLNPGSKLARLQTLLKAEELESDTERRMMEELNRQAYMASSELCNLVWEVRMLDKLIGLVNHNQIEVKDTQFRALSGIFSKRKQDDPGKKETVAAMEAELRESLETLVSILRLDPAYLGQTLKNAKYLEGSQYRNTWICQAIVFSLYGNCFTPTDEKLLLNLITYLCKLEIDVELASSKGKNKKRESFALTLLSTYMNYTYGKPYLINTLRDVVLHVLQDITVNFEPNAEKQALLADTIPTKNNVHVAADSPVINLKQKFMMQLLSVKLLSRVIERLESLPYGLRWIAKVVVDTRTARDPNMTPAKKRAILVEIVFENFLIPAMIKPEQCGVVSGLYISPRSRNNLIMIARLILEFVTSPEKNQQILKEHNLYDKIDEYFEKLTDVTPPELYFLGSESEYFEVTGNDRKHRLMMASTDLYMLIEIILHNQEPGQNYDDVIYLILTVQKYSNIQEGSKFLILNVATQVEYIENYKKRRSKELSQPSSTRTSVSSTTNNNNTTDEEENDWGWDIDTRSKVDFAKQNLLLLLRVLDYLCGYSGNDLLFILEQQRSRNRTYEGNILDAQIRETITRLKDLPEIYTSSNYQLLIEEMLMDYQERCKTQAKKRDSLLIFLDRLRRHTAEVNATRMEYAEYLTHIKCKEYRERTYDQIQTSFIENFSRMGGVELSVEKSFCRCLSSIDSEREFVCTNCSIKSELVHRFVEETRENLMNDILWMEAGIQEIDMAVRNLERDLMTQLYHLTFMISAEDEPFAEKLKSCDLSLTEMYIPPEYHVQAPWTLAQNELRKLNLYKSPHDKLRCIISCWNIIFNYVRPIGECGPDTFLPIMAYVIMKSRPPHIISNINYIRHYTTIDESAEIPFVNFQSALQILMDLIPESPTQSKHQSHPGPLSVKASVSAPDTSSSAPADTRGTYYGKQYKLRASTIKTYTSIANTYKQRKQQQRQEAETKFNNNRKVNNIRDKFKFTDERFYYSDNDPRMHLRASEIEEVISQLEPLSPRSSSSVDKKKPNLAVTDIAY